MWIESKLAKAMPALMIDSGVGVVGFVLALGWGKASGRDMDRDTVIFLAKAFGGIVFFGVILAFIL